MLSAEWLYDELFEAVAARLPDLTTPSGALDTDEQQAPSPPGAAGGGTGGGSATARELLAGVRWPARAGRVLTQVFRETDQRLLSFLRAEFGEEAMGLSGSTALVALVAEDRAVLASLGDCMAVLCRKGAAVKATQQHRVYGVGPDVLEGESRHQQ